MYLHTILDEVQSLIRVKLSLDSGHINMPTLILDEVQSLIRVELSLEFLAL